MIDYETFARIHDCRDRQGLTTIQIARTLGLNRKTVAKWLARPRYAPQRQRLRHQAVQVCSAAGAHPRALATA